MALLHSPETCYDVFLSYSSADSGPASRVQRFLESYRHPRGIFGSSTLRIKVFRDKTDQGLTPDFAAVFKERISQCPVFLLLGSEAACASPHVAKECEFFLQTGRESLNLALVGRAAEGSFPSSVLTRFPRAIYADLRMTRGSGLVRWWLADRRRFRDEMLRIVASVLQHKAGIPLSYEALRLRERQRRVRRTAISCVSAAILSIALAVYYARTDVYGVHWTALGRAKVAKIVLPRPSDRGIQLFADTEARKFWPDPDGHEGTDVDVVIYGLDGRGISQGTLAFTYLDEWDRISEPRPSGIFASMTTNAVSDLLSSFGYQWPDPNPRSTSDLVDLVFPWKADCDVHQANQKLTHRFDAQRAIQVCGNDHTSPSVAYYSGNAGGTWTRVAEFPFHLKNASIWSSDVPPGVAFVGTGENVDPYYGSSGGLFVTRDYGQTWKTVAAPSGGWNTLEAIGGNPRNPQLFAVALGVSKRSGEIETAGIWLTRNGGAAWEPAGLQGVSATVTDIHVTEQGNVFALANKELVVYRLRSVIDRLFQRYDLPAARKP